MHVELLEKYNVPGCLVKSFPMTKRIGVWLDFKEAFIIELNDGEEASVQQIPSGVEDFHVRGGSRTKQPWGPMDKTSESKYLGRRETQIKHYYTRLMEAVGDADKLFIFGPAEAKKGLEKAIAGSRNFKPELLSTETAGSMTRNQMAARVRDFFDAVTN